MERNYLVETLNIFKTTEQILFFLTAEELVENVPRMWLHTIYPQAVKTVLEMHSLVYMANMEQEERERYLKRYLCRLNELKALTRLMHERRMITHKQSDHLFELYESVFKQASAWKRKTLAKQHIV